MARITKGCRGGAGRGRQLGLEALEGRAVPTVTFSNGVLEFIVGIIVAVILVAIVGRF